LKCRIVRVDKHSHIHLSLLKSHNFILSFRKSNSRHAKKERAKNSDHTVFLSCMAADLICTEKSQILLLLPMPFLFIS
jgi:hypothetical protein